MYDGYAGRLFVQAILAKDCSNSITLAATVETLDRCIYNSVSGDEILSYIDCYLSLALEMAISIDYYKLESLEAELHKLCDLYCQKESVGFLDGLVGYGIVLIKLYELKDNCAIGHLETVTLAVINRGFFFGDSMYWQTDGLVRGPSLGFAHGDSGILLFLALASAKLNSKTLAEIVSLILRKYYIGNSINTTIPDNRLNPAVIDSDEDLRSHLHNHVTSDHSWCNGSDGFALALVACCNSGIHVSDANIALLRYAINHKHKSTPNSSLCLCHGQLSSIFILRMIEDLALYKGEHIAQILDNAMTNVRAWSTEIMQSNNESCEYSLFTGHGGLALVLIDKLKLSRSILMCQCRRGVTSSSAEFEAELKQTVLKKFIVDVIDVSARTLPQPTSSHRYISLFDLYTELLRPVFEKHSLSILSCALAKSIVRFYVSERSRLRSLLLVSLSLRSRLPPDSWWLMTSYNRQYVHKLRVGSGVIFIEICKSNLWVRSLSRLDSKCFVILANGAIVAIHHRTTHSLSNVTIANKTDRILLAWSGHFLKPC